MDTVDNIKMYQTNSVGNLVRAAMHDASVKDYRTGQALFNLLPPAVATVVSGQLWDPFHKDWPSHVIAEWIDKHLVFSGQEIIAVFNNDQILWEKS